MPVHHGRGAEPRQPPPVSSRGGTAGVRRNALGEGASAEEGAGEGGRGRDRPVHADRPGASRMREATKGGSADPRARGDGPALRPEPDRATRGPGPIPVRARGPLRTPSAGSRSAGSRSCPPGSGDAGGWLRRISHAGCHGIKVPEPPRASSRCGEGRSRSRRRDGVSPAGRVPVWIALRRSGAREASGGVRAIARSSRPRPAGQAGRVVRPGICGRGGRGAAVGTRVGTGYPQRRASVMASPRPPSRPARGGQPRKPS